MIGRVVILQETLPHYRVPLMAAIIDAASQRGIKVLLLHGSAPGARGSRMNSGALDAATLIDNKYFTIPGGNGVAVWQAALSRCLAADLIVVEQANRLLLNYVLLALRRGGGPAVAFWGHGRNYQSRKPSGFLERLKAALAKSPDWWFAYTRGVAEYLVQLGYPERRVTIVENTIDVVGLRSSVAQAQTTVQPTEARRCLFLGGLYEDKRLNVLFSAADLVILTLPTFELHIAGGGELERQVRAYAAERSWVHYHGQVSGQDRAALLATSELLLIPGLVGLVVLDSFAAGVPLVTMADAPHSPEIAYLTDQIDGTVLPEGASPTDYAACVVRLLMDGVAREKLRLGALRAADRHSVEGAAARFVDGLESALTSSRLRRRRSVVQQPG